MQTVPGYYYRRAVPIYRYGCLNAILRTPLYSVSPDFSGTFLTYSMAAITPSPITTKKNCVRWTYLHTLSVSSGIDSDEMYKQGIVSIYSRTRGVTSLSLSPSSPMLRDCLSPVQPAGVLVEVGYIEYLASMPPPARNSHSSYENLTAYISYQLPIRFAVGILIRFIAVFFQLRKLLRYN